ncbi:unnamed protein product [Ilex paraguariensis]|uniref:Uncharacterized protein n=1 Tax=Ilex paraguariensis TaxID=185542 RepID=A0ABC8TE16_9AQUA
MKRVFDEISDEEWSNHSFKSSKVFQPPPPIESFVYNKSSAKPSKSNSNSSDDSIEILEANWTEKLEDSDAEDNLRGIRPQANRGRRFVIEDDEEESDGCDFERVIEVKSEEEEEEVVEEVEEEGDVVGKALQKCAKISEELRKELYGSAVAACDRYAEVEASSVKIVTQEDVCVACGAEDSGFQPVLKPYQLVGVNFLLLLYRKKIGGGT